MHVTPVHEPAKQALARPAPASARPRARQHFRFERTPCDPVGPSRIRLGDWSEGAIVLMSGDGVGSAVRIDRVDALVLQIRLDEPPTPWNHVALRDRADGQPQMQLRAGEAILHDLRQPRLLRAPARTLQIGLDRQILTQVAEDLNIHDADPVEEFLPVYGMVLADPALYHLAVSVGETLDRGDRWAGAIRRQLTHAVAAHLLGTYTRLKPAPETVRGGLAPWQLRRAQDRIRADLAQAIDLRAVSESCGLSVSHFARAFRQSTGIAPHSWLTGERIARAKVMMRRKDRTLADIALACGFADQSHFTRAFAKNQGTTPGRWRRLMEPEARHATMP